MNLRAIFSVNGLRIVLYAAKLYNFAYVVIALNYANLSKFFSQSSRFYHFFMSEFFTLPGDWWGARSLSLGKEPNH